MSSRRRFLAGCGAALGVGLAGCSGSGSGGSEDIDCQTSSVRPSRLNAPVNEGNGDVLDGGAMARVFDGGDVRLEIPLPIAKVKRYDVHRLELFDAYNTLQYVIPVSPNDQPARRDDTDQLVYQQYLGKRPFNGRYTIVAAKSIVHPIDSITIEFNCFADTDG